MKKSLVIWQIRAVNEETIYSLKGDGVWRCKDDSGGGRVSPNYSCVKRKNYNRLHLFDWYELSLRFGAWLLKGTYLSPSLSKGKNWTFLFSDQNSFPRPERNNPWQAERTDACGLFHLLCSSSDLSETLMDKLQHTGVHGIFCELKNCKRDGN